MENTLTALQTIRNYQYEGTLKLIQAAKKLGKISVGQIYKVVTMSAEIKELNIEDYSLSIDDNVLFLQANLCGAVVTNSGKSIRVKFN